MSGQREQRENEGLETLIPDRSREQRLPRRAIVARVLLGVLFVLGAYLSLIPSGRAAMRAAVLLPALVTQTEPASLQVVGETVRHRELVVQSTSGPVFLDVFEPDMPAPPLPGAREGVLLIPGVGDNRHDAQLVNFAEALARSGLVAVAMTTTTLLDYILTPDDADAVTEAVLAMGRLPGVDPKRVGILGFSAGGALATRAATDPRIRDTLAFITLFGGYFDVRTMLADIGRRGLIVNGQPQPWQPNAVTLQVLANTLGTGLPSGDATRLSDAFSVDPYTSLADDELRQLSPAGVAGYHLLAGDEPSRAEANVATVTEAMRPLLEGLSPSTAVAEVHTTIYLLHDRNDQYVPFTESRAFDAALNHLGMRHELAEFGIFQHVEVRSNLGLGPLLADGVNLYRIVSGLLLPAS